MVDTHFPPAGASVPTVSKGIDIYRYQAVTDPAAVKRSGIEFAWVKLTDGPGKAAVPGDHQVSQMRNAGIPVGGYHFSQPGDPQHQADILLAEVRRLKATGLMPALDLEDNPPSTKKPNIPHGQKRAWATAFCRRVQSSGFRPAVYLNASDAGTLRPDRWGIPGLVIWIAAYGSNSGAPYNPKIDIPKITGHYPGRYDVHQHTSRGHVPGIAGDVDLNFWVTTQPSEEDDVQLTDKWDPKALTAKPNTVGHALLNIQQNALAARTLAAQAVAANSKDLTAAQVEKIVDDAIVKAIQEAGGAS